MFFRTLMMTLAMVAVCLTTSAAKANDHIEYYMHNGSLMKLVWNQEVPEFFNMYYERPRAGLSVRKGTRLMSGSEPAGGGVSATAYTFKRGCQPAAYRVSGWFDEDGDLSLTGNEPVRRGCKVVGYAPGNNSSLVFKRRH